MRKIIVWLFILFPFALCAQNTKEVKGTVTSADGSPLPGASVFVDKNTIGESSDITGVIKSFSLGTTTDIDGRFSLELPKSIKELRFSFIGFKTKTVNIIGKVIVSVVLEEDKNMLDEVIVTGYQKIEKRKLTSAVSKVKTEDILQSGVSSVDQMLGGQLAGVQTNLVSGAPGAPAKIRIRGTASLNGTQDPLWVLDGVPLEGTELPDLSEKNIDDLFNSSIAGINPMDIEDITILKDAAATAIYGARAANGVILISTKSGREGKPRITFNTNFSLVSKPDMTKLNLMNASEKIDMELMLAGYKDLDSYNSDTKKGAVGRIFEEKKLWNLYREKGFSGLPQDVQSEINHLKTINTDWGNELYQTSINQEYGLSISGGTEKSSYYLSVGYYDEKGTTVGTGLNRLNITLKGEHKLRDNLTIGAALYTNERKQESYLTAAGSFTNPSRYSRRVNPYLPIKDEKGKFIYDPDIHRYNGKLLDYNIIEERDNTSNESKTRSLNAVFDINWEVIPKLNIKTQLGLQKDNSTIEQYGHKNSYFVRLGREKGFKNNKYFIPEGGIIKNWEGSLDQWNLKTTAEYNLKVNDAHEFDLMIGNELRKSKDREIFTAGYGFNKETLTTKPIVFPEENDASTFPLYKKNFVENAFASFFATVGYTYNRKYTFFGSVRSDGSDLFGVDPKYKWLPIWAASVAWRIKEENFLKNANWIDDLKLRLSYGLQGNIDKGTSKFIVGSKNYVTLLPENTETVIVADNLPNDRLRWEKTATYNMGVDIAILNNRISLSADYYYRKSTDLIGARAIALENGLGVVPINWAELTNKGLEFNLRTVNITSDNFNWTTTFNFAKNTNTVDKIEVRDNQTTPSLLGHSVNSLFALKTAGLDEQGYVQFEKDGKIMSATEFFKLEDPSGWGFYQSALSNKEIRELYTYKGTRDPKFSGGFINNFSYKNFSLNISCSYNIGQWVKTEPFYSIIEMDRGWNRSTMMEQVWRPDNISGTYPRMITGATENSSRMADYMAFNTGLIFSNDMFRDLDIWYKEINFIRVNSLRLGYNIADNFLEKVGVSSARLSFEARNPFVFGSDYEGYFDPETYGNIYAQPIARSFTIGLNVTF